MNVFVLVAIVAAVVISVEGGGMNKDMIDDVEKAGKKCMGEVKSKPEDLEFMKKHEAPATTPSKCTLACIFKEMGVMKDDKYVSAGMIEVGKKIMGEDKDKMELFKSIATECEPLSMGTDACDTAAKIWQCSFDLAKKNNIDMLF